MPSQRISADITSGTILRTILILLGFWFLYVISDILLMLFAAVVISSAIEPIANYFQYYRLPRALSVAVVYLLLLLVLSGTVTLLVQPLTEQITQLALAIPHLVANLSHLISFVPQFDQQAVTVALQEGLLRLGQNLANVGLNVIQQTRSLFSGIFTLLFIFILAFYLVVEKDALKKFARLITPREHLPYIERSIERAQRSIGRWVLAQLALALIIGVVVGLGLWLMGIKYALVLGLLAGILEIVPVIGPVIAAIPGVLVGLAQSWVIGVAALIFYIVVQQLENNLLVPTIMRRAIGLNPLVTIIAILLGARLAGVAGVILSVPMAAIISIFLSDLFAAPAIEDELPG
ncbi:MAG: AI-2E family transporter [Candidatus Andersenbacteria bacterium]